MNNSSFGFLLLFWAFYLPAKAQNNAEKPQPSAKFQAYFKAQALINEGYAQKKAEPFIKAVEILIENPTHAYEPQADDGITVDSVVNEKIAKIEKPIISFDVSQLLKDARVFAKSDKPLLKSIALLEERFKQLKRPKSKGSIEGAGVSRSYQVDAYSSRTFYSTFKRGELAELAILGDGDTNLDLYIYNKNNQLIESDTDNSDKCYVKWHPQHTSRYKMVIKNRGKVYNNFLLMTN